MSNKQVILEDEALVEFQEKIIQCIKQYAASYDHSLAKSKEKYEPEMRKKGWFRKAFVNKDEEITEAHLQEYIHNHVQDQYHFGWRGERTPIQIEKKIQDNIELLNKYLVKTNVKLVLDLEVYDNYMNSDYSSDRFFNCS